VWPARGLAVAKQCLDLAGEQQPSLERSVVEWLHAEPVVDQHQPTMPGLPEGGDKLAVQADEEGRTGGFVAVGQKFGGPATLKPVAQALEGRFLRVQIKDFA